MAMKIAVLGSGNVGSALGAAWVRAGHQVVFGVRDVAKGTEVKGASVATMPDAVRRAEVVALAVPWSAVSEVLKQCDTSGKIVIDCTNPLSSGLQLVVGFNSSGGEQVAALAPKAKVAKAFNTTGYGNMENPNYGGKGLTMLFCTDHDDVKPALEKLVRDVGFAPEFAGPLKQARYLEPLAMLWITMSMQIGRDFAFSLVRRQG